MPNIATVLKEEISRLARKEVKARTEATRQASAQYRREIAQLKRQVQSLAKQVGYLERQERKRALKPVSDAIAKGKRFSPQGLKAHRNKLGLSAADYAELVGVTAQTIYGWEQGRSKPRQQQLAALVTIRGLGKREALRRLDVLDG